MKYSLLLQAMEFTIASDFKPTGDQPQAIDQLTEGIQNGTRAQTLLGVTGSGKTFTMANVIKEVQRPTLILSHNKTLAAQLYGEFKQFFPDNAVEYFVSYYDYYQPEAYIPTSNTYIEKDLSINDEIEKMRLSTISSLLSGRRDVLVVSSVSCIYGSGNPNEFDGNIVTVNRGQTISRNKLLHELVQALYSRTEMDLGRGNFRVKGDTVDVFLAYADYAIRIGFWGDEIEEIYTIDPYNNSVIEELEVARIYPANLFVTSKQTLESAIHQIQHDLVHQVDFFKEVGKPLEAKRLEDRTVYDIEMLRELGYCPGIENYSRYLDGRAPGTRPYCLMDYFPEDYLLFIDESHVTVSQIKAMYGGDRSRKTNLVEYGFRLPAAMDNRPLKFEEWYGLINQVVYVSATPAKFELQESEGVIVEQVIRPTGLLDPVIEIRPVRHQVDDLMEEIAKTIEKGQRVLVTTLTKRMAEELTKYLARLDVRCRYIHSDVDTLERVEILRDLRLGMFDVLIGINLLREGLDLPEVSLVAILDADKEGFLRSHTALTQTAGRAARHLEGRVIMYADKVTEAMRLTIEETQRRRGIQEAYNVKHGLHPKALSVSREKILKQASVAAGQRDLKDAPPENKAADVSIQYMSQDDLQKTIDKTRKEMQKAAKELDFLLAARLRDEIIEMEKLVRKR